ncbi:MAG: exodeoxyribonuclease VII small subunit [Candidatus Atribacteria bacterium]|nr:exodeoxyribonuclease VII small subunit [Candidatus Atribacteria bacterium]MCD6349463.1 exodeoxyribonuclease VII small subunit [Candidatus Atribacteria bacterium]
MSKEKIDYRQAIEELQLIVNELERGELDLDSLLEKVKRAAFLCSFCKSRLREVEKELEAVFLKMEEELSQENSSPSSNDV